MVRLLSECPYCKNKFDSPMRILEADQERYGIHKIIVDKESYVEKKGFTCIKAEYLDCGRSLKNGELFFYRSIEERDNKIREYFKEKERQNLQSEMQ